MNETFRLVEVALQHDDSTDTIYPFQQANEGRLADPSASLRAAAPPLTNLFVAHVCSDNAGCEAFSTNQFSTSLTHGGANIEVYVWEIGYGNTQVATQGGTTVSSQYKVDYRGVCAASGGGYTVNCASGATYIGWRYVWNVAYYLNNNYGSYFGASNTSANAPFNTYSTLINIHH